MKFWELQHPDYESDYQLEYINGSLEHPFSLPGVKCSVCGETWGGSRILPYECPPEMRNHKHLRSAWAIPLEQHKALQKDVLVKLKEQGASVCELFPGDSFQPCYLDVPSKPRADFLWACLGSLVVSERIKNLLLEHCGNDIACCEVVLRRIGKLEASLPAPIPSTGEPEDMVEEVPLTSDRKDVGRYFEICILKESDWPPGGAPERICTGCGRPEVNTYKREIRMTAGMWRGEQMFLLATTLYVIVTDDLKRILESARPTNVVFSKIWQDEGISV